MKYRLPVIVERTVRESEIARHEIENHFERNFRSQLSDEGKLVSCFKGCDHCCHYPITLSVLEGISLYLWLVKHGKWGPDLKRKLEQAAEKTSNLKPEVWLLSLIPCPFLEQHECSIYEGRPLVCRTTYSLSDPESCHPHQIGEASHVSRLAVIQEAASVENRLGKRIRLPYVKIPLASAVLYGERIVRGDLDVEDVIPDVLKESDT